jgi:saccharopine dehydrogenase-like NADP-dependent oxidoreductase
MIGIVGAGVVGSRIAEQLVSSGSPVVVFDRDQYRSRRLAALHARNGDVRVAESFNDMLGTPATILATGDRHAAVARALLESGTNVVSCGDNMADVEELLMLDNLARERGRTLVVGAAASPGFTGLLIRHLEDRLDSMDEVHIAMHGTGGPDCARQHHRALSGQSRGWHDGEWLLRPGGSGRELCWFPEPVGAYDCYRSEMADPVLLHRAMPQLQRITARTSATRRDRFTSRLPMLAPPHAEGGMGALRVEVRGFLGQARVVEVGGVAERVGQIAGIVASATALHLHQFATGCRVLGDESSPNAEIYHLVSEAGVRVHRFVGSA